MDEIYIAQMDYGYGKSDKSWLPCTKDDEFIYFKRDENGVHAWHCNKVSLSDHRLLDLKPQAFKIMWEYAIIPISFKDYNEYVDCLNDYGKEGWIFGAMIRTYEDSPMIGITTHDYVCRRANNFYCL